MGKKARWILLVVVVLLAAGFGFAKFRAKHEPVARWALPDGTELRLEYVTYGTKHRIPGVGALGAWSSQMANRWLHLRLPYYQAEYRVEDTEFPCPVVWFTLLNPQTGKLSQPNITGVAALAEPGAIRLRSLNGNSSNGNLPFPCAAFRITAYPRRTENIRLRIDLGGQIIEGNIPNPARGQSYVEWKPEPLPQTRRVGTREFTLKELKLFRWKGGPPWGPVQLSPGYVIREGSGEVSEGFTVDTELLDATGNKNLEILPLDESAWKIRAYFWRNGGYPFAPDEGLTLGPVEVPGPGEYHEFEIPADETKNGIRLVALVGAGHFVWQDGKFLTAKAVIEPSTAANGTYGPGNRVRLEQTFSDPSLILLLEGKSVDKWVKNSGRIIVRLHVGGKGYLMQAGGGTGGGGVNGIQHQEKLFVAPWAEHGNRIPLSGPVSIQIVPVEPETVEFIVAPPKLPEPSP